MEALHGFHMTTNLELKARAFGMGIINPNYRYQKIMIQDIPLMITSTGKLLCIPKTMEVKHIGSVGMSGAGKSVIQNLLLTWDYWLCGRDCLILNDFQTETFEWSRKAKEQLFFHKKINAQPCPSPIVYIFPSTETLKIQERLKLFPNLKMTLPLKDVIKNLEDYHSLDKSKVYVTNLMEKLADCNSMMEIQEIIEEEIPKKHNMMKFKIINIFQSLFKSQILNVTVPEAPAFLEYYDKRGNKYYNTTVQTLLRAGLIPSIQTSDLKNHDFFSAFMSFIVDTLYNNQYEDDYFKNRIISLFVDEIDKLWKDKKNGDLIKIQLGLVGTNGRACRIGLRWSTQNYNAVPEQIKGNTKYLTIAKLKDDKEVNDICKDFDIPKEMRKDALHLRKEPEKGIFEIIALTTEKFILYDLTDGRKEYTTEVHRGYLIPPLASHYVPSTK
jgi:hypothetical protein